MTRGDGFEQMDVSTAIFEDPKFKKLARLHPSAVAVGFTAYIAVVAMSWRHGSRVNVEDAWPLLLHFEPETVVALQDVGLLDAKGKIPAPIWRAWYGLAAERRENSRARWKRANSHRAATAKSPRGAREAPRPSSPTRSSPSSSSKNKRAAAREAEPPAARSEPPMSMKAAVAKYGYDPEGRPPED
jgi:hypothetical protein